MTGVQTCALPILRLINDVFEWSTDKYNMHEDVKGYFFGRNEDEFYQEGIQ